MGLGPPTLLHSMRRPRSPTWAVPGPPAAAPGGRGAAESAHAGSRVVSAADCVLEATADGWPVQPCQTLPGCFEVYHMAQTPLLTRRRSCSLPQAHATELSLAGQPGAAAAPWWAFTVQQPSAVFEPGRTYTLRLELTCIGGGSSSSSSMAVRAACSAVELPVRPAASSSGRQLAQATTAIFDTPSPPLPPVSVTLAPLSGAAASGGSQTVVVDGYSGLARAINATSAAPVCGTAAAASATRCLRNPVLRTAANQIVLVLTLGSGGALATGGSIGPAISLSGNASVASTRRTTLQTVEVTVRLLSDQPVTGVHHQCSCASCCRCWLECRACCGRCWLWNILLAAAAALARCCWHVRHPCGRSSLLPRSSPALCTASHRPLLPHGSLGG